MENKFESAIKKIAEIMGVELNTETTQPEQKKVQNSDYTLTDGTVISVEGELAEGTVVNVYTTDGVLPAMDGDLTLEDGTVINVSGGKIASVTTPAPVEENQNEVNPLEERIAKLESTLAEITTKLSAQEELQVKLSAVVKTIGEVSISEPVQRTESVEQTEQTNRTGNKRLFSNAEEKRLDSLFKAVRK